METNSIQTRQVLLKYTLDPTESIAANCDHWTATDYAGAVDSGLLKYEGLVTADTIAANPANDSVTVFMYVDALDNATEFNIEDYKPGLVDALQAGRCTIEVSNHHTIVITVKVIITDHHIPHGQDE